MNPSSERGRKHRTTGMIDVIAIKITHTARRAVIVDAQTRISQLARTLIAETRAVILTTALTLQKTDLIEAPIEAPIGVTETVDTITDRLISGTITATPTKAEPSEEPDDFESTTLEPSMVLRQERPQ
jgi:hypothetical protein